ncbi:hexokinase type 2-like [Oratosquilla oratoria]|uniref:hexokinase type 2-like n=1 Tax=Oratosquilla oratoria TaxID=337810 RepID=UPI003F7611ED
MASPLDLPTLSLGDKVKERRIQERLASLCLSPERVQKVRDVFLEEMELGLASAPTKKSSLQMENTFIPELPDGSENGEYLALDLGGTNFRVIYIKYQDGSVVEEFVDYYHVEEPIRLGPGEVLFDFLADCIADFTKRRNLDTKQLPLGFTFSFPMTQKSLDVGILVSWTKSFNCPGVVGEDAVQMLSEAINRKGLKVEVVAVLNDTTGTLVQGAFLDRRCAIGMILGTGSNGCYIEHVERIEKWKGEHKEKEVIIDIEWGAFGDNGVLDFIKTEWDRAVDQESLLVNSFTYEKYFGGKYLGDLVRHVLLTLTKEGLYCGPASVLSKQGTLTTSLVSRMEKEAFEGKTTETLEALQKIGLNASEEHAAIAQYVAGLLSYRGIQLVCVPTGELLKRMSKNHCAIAIDGSLYEHHPRFKVLMEKLLKDFAPSYGFNLFLARDGSGKGAALAAAIAERLQRQT